MPEGTVKWFNDTKAFGFIAPDEGDDVFVHVTGLAEGVTTIKEEQRVQFEVTQGRKGLQAVDVKPLGDKPAEAAPVADEPVADEPVADEPVADEPAEAEPVADEPVADEPVAEEAEADESAE